VAWTSPKTWSFGEILTSTDMNTYVRDNTLALFGRGLLQAPNVLTTTNFTSTSTTAVDLTGVEVAITPTSATSRILLMFTAQVASSANGGSNWYQFRRDTTDLFEEVQRRSGDNQDIDTFAMMFDEVAGSTTARTYKIRTRTSSGTQTVFSSSLIVVEYAV
jgi:hypothetical protein